jgi:hypothetical protein
MKIDIAIMSCDDACSYSQFWEPVSLTWNLKFGIRPKLIYFGEKEMSAKYGDVVKVAPIKDIPLYFQSVWARFWYTSLEPHKVHITSDIDMFPVSKKFFIEDLHDYSNDSYVHLRGAWRPLPVCYHAAKGSTFCDVLSFPDTFEESCREVFNSDCHSFSHNGNLKWGLEESYTTDKLLNSKHPSLVLMNRGLGGTRGRKVPTRLDGVADYHSDRPYIGKRHQIDSFIVDNLLWED